VKLDINHLITKDNLICHSGRNWGKHNIWKWKGLSCHWRVLGEGNDIPLLLIHGFGASSDHWRNNAIEYANAGFCVFAIDLIGFGQSEQPSTKSFGFLNNDVWSEQVIQFIEQIIQSNNFEKVSIISNSLGSLVALTSYAVRPDLINSIVAAPLPDPDLVQNIILPKSTYVKKLQSYLIKLFFHLLPLEIIIPLIIRTRFINCALQFAYTRSISSDKQLKKIVTIPAKRATAAQALRAMCIGMSLRPEWSTAPRLLLYIQKELSKPKILLIWGRKDKLVPISLAKQLIKQHSWIKLSVMENSGHCPHDESPTQFNKLALDWLKNS
tara:strand:- start:123 stop:1097 length:975 start_codon:yes stop_codon:yes gene_type:complete